MQLTLEVPKGVIELPKHEVHQKCSRCKRRKQYEQERKLRLVSLWLAIASSLANLLGRVADWFKHHP